MAEDKKVAAVATEKLKHPIINNDRATVVTEDGETKTAKGKTPADAVQKAADKIR